MLATLVFIDAQMGVLLDFASEFGEL